MTTTVTTTTVSTINSTQIAAVLGLIIILAFVFMVIGKDVSVGSTGRNSVHWNGPLNVGIIPLAISFLVIVLVNLSNAIS